MPQSAKPTVREFRDFQAKEQRVAREDGKPAKLTGYAATFNSDSRRMIDSRGKPFIERIAPGAFANTIKNADVRALVNHDANMVIGRTKAGTLRLNEDDVGLRYECDLPDTGVGRDAATSVERGDMDGCSFGFRTVRDSWEVKDGINVRTLLEVELIDVGPVTFPAYEATSVDVRSLLARTAEARGLVEYDDPCFGWRCSYLVSYCRALTDSAEGLIQAVEDYDDQITDADQRAADDALSAIADVLAKLKLAKVSLKGFGTTAADVPAAAADDADDGAGVVETTIETNSAKPVREGILAKYMADMQTRGLMSVGDARKFIA